jgi:hypothetical protein
VLPPDFDRALGHGFLHRLTLNRERNSRVIASASASSITPTDSCGATLRAFYALRAMSSDSQRGIISRRAIGGVHNFKIFMHLKRVDAGKESVRIESSKKTGP